MAWESWRAGKQTHCEVMDEKVTLQSRLAFAADNLPDQPPRVLAHRCSSAENCDHFDQNKCPWESLSSSR
jgi:hypothetical protein